MSLTDVLQDALPARRGRPPKVQLTPVREALAAPLPAGLEPAAEKVEAASKAFESAANALSEARSAEAKIEADAKVRQAEARFQTASVQAEIAERNGERDGPSDEDLKALEVEVEAAKAARDGFEPRIAAYKAERERRRELLKRANDEFDAVEKSVRQRLLDAIDEQLGRLVDLHAEAKAAMLIRDGYDELPRGAAPSMAMVAGDGYHVGTASLDVPEELKRAYRILRRGQHLVTSYRDPGDPI